MPVAIDTETRLISRPHGAPRMVCTTWDDGSGPGIVRHDQAVPIWKNALESERIVTGHNFAFDAAVAMAYDSDLIAPMFRAYSASRIEDTLLNQKLLDIAAGELKFRKTRGYDLGEVARRHGQHVDKSDPWRMRYAELENIPLEMWPSDAPYYAKRDATVTYRVQQSQHEKDDCDALKQAPARARFALALHLTGLQGVRTNPERVEKLKVATAAKIATLQALLAETGLVRKSGSRNTKLAKARLEAAFNALGKEIPLTKTGNTAVDRDACILSGDETLVKYAEFTRLNTLTKRIEDLAQGVELPLQPRYDSLMETGRSSSSKGKGGSLVGCQIQNFPRGEGPRECLEPRAGNCFIVADYESAELHSLAEVCRFLFGFSVLGDLLNKGVDVHTWFAAQALLHCSYEEAIARVKAGDPVAKAARQAAKAIIYGVPGGMGAAKLVLTGRKSYGVKLTEPEAKRLRQMYLTAAPELAMLFKFVEGLLGGGQIGSITHPITGFVRGGATYSAMANHTFQHLTAQGALSALYEVCRECYADTRSSLYGCRPVFFVHDEIGCEAPIEQAHDAATRLGQIMEEQMNLWTPTYPTPAEPYATMIWGKNAKRLLDRHGRIVPYGLEKVAA